MQGFRRRIEWLGSGEEFGLELDLGETKMGERRKAERGGHGWNWRGVEVEKKIRKCEDDLSS